MDAAKETFSKFLKKRGIRHSKQREWILDLFLKNKNHLSVADVYALARGKYPNIGYSTVYRAMKVICESGLAERIDFGDGTGRFEYTDACERHDHLVCIDCDKLVEVSTLELKKAQEKIAEEYGFSFIKQGNILLGRCKKCRK